MPRFTRRKSGMMATAHVKVHVPRELVEWVAQRMPEMNKHEAYKAIVFTTLNHGEMCDNFTVAAPYTDDATLQIGTEGYIGYDDEYELYDGSIPTVSLPWRVR